MRAGLISCMKWIGILCNGQSMILRGELYWVLHRWEMQGIGVIYGNGKLAIKLRENLSRMPK